MILRIFDVNKERGASVLEAALITGLVICIILFVVTFGRFFYVDSLARDNTEQALRTTLSNVSAWDPSAGFAGPKFADSLNEVEASFGKMGWMGGQLLDVQNDVDASTRKFAFIPPGFCATVLAWGQQVCNNAPSAATPVARRLREYPIEIRAFYEIDFPFYGTVRRSVSASGFPRLMTWENVLPKENETGNPVPATVPGSIPVSICTSIPPNMPYSCRRTNPGVCSAPVCNTESFRFETIECIDNNSGAIVADGNCNGGLGCPDSRVSCGIPWECNCRFKETGPCHESAGCGSPWQKIELWQCYRIDHTPAGLTGWVGDELCGGCPDNVLPCPDTSSCSCMHSNDSSCQWGAGCGSWGVLTHYFSCWKIINGWGNWTAESECGGCPDSTSGCPPPWDFWNAPYLSCAGVNPPCDGSSTISGSYYCLGCCPPPQPADDSATCVGPPCSTSSGASSSTTDLSTSTAPGTTTAATSTGATSVASTVNSSTGATTAATTIPTTVSSVSTTSVATTLSICELLPGYCGDSGDSDSGGIPGDAGGGDCGDAGGGGDEGGAGN